MKDMFTPRRLCYYWFHYECKNIANNKTKEGKDAPTMGDFNSLSRVVLTGLRQIKKQFRCLSVNSLSLKVTMGREYASFPPDCRSNCHRCRSIGGSWIYLIGISLRDQLWGAKLSSNFTTVNLFIELKGIIKAKRLGILLYH